eukprot:gene16095-biopygen15790
MTRAWRGLQGFSVAWGGVGMARAWREALRAPDFLFSNPALIRVAVSAWRLMSTCGPSACQRSLCCCFPYRILLAPAAAAAAAALWPAPWFQPVPDHVALARGKPPPAELGETTCDAIGVRPELPTFQLHGTRPWHARRRFYLRARQLQGNTHSGCIFGRERVLVCGQRML